MLRITLTQENGSPPTIPLSHDFDERGGTIGRDASNALALPDPNRHVSRMQAQVGYDGESYTLTDHGGNPTSLNGRPLGKGVSATLHDGDDIGIADHVLRVEVITKAKPSIGTTAAAPAPTNDPLGLFAPPGPEAAGAAPAAAKSPTAPAAPFDDDPFAVFIPSTPSVTSDAPPVQDVDPFAPAAKPPESAGSRGKDPDPLGIGGLAQTGQANSLDALFGLDAAGAAHDPFAGSPLGDPAHSATPPSGDNDPFALFGGPARPASAPTTGDDSPLLREAFTPPRPIEPVPTDAAPALEPAEPEKPRVTPNPLPSTPPGGVVSWATPAPGPEAARQEPPAASAEAVTRIAPPLTPAQPARNDLTASPKPAAAPAPTSVAEQPAAPDTAPPPCADSDALLAAFARGIGLPRLAPPGGMTPEFMEHVGGMLREAVQGTVELLIARAATKREVRADVTMIVSKNNNPLKFSPDVDFALMQLIVPPGSGFMPPTEAMRDAYDDLRAHQIGFVAGLRAALASVLNRFTPTELEARLTTRSLLDSVLPANRKAKLWDLYEQRYSEISREAEDDFHSLFGREFLKAYEAQIAQLQRGRE